MNRHEHAPQNSMEDPAEIARFHDRCSDLMRELLDGLAAAPGVPRPFPVVEDAISWPRRRIASVLGGVSHLRHTEFGGRRPYRFLSDRRSASGRWEIWMDAEQAAAVREAAVPNDFANATPDADAIVRSALPSPARRPGSRPTGARPPA